MRRTALDHFSIRILLCLVVVACIAAFLTIRAFADEEATEGEGLTSIEAELPSATLAATPYSVEYRAHVASVGWQAAVKDGASAGTTGRSRAIESIEIKLVGTGYTGSVEYRTHVQYLGWQDWVKDGRSSGTTGRSLATESISIKLTGEIANYYDINYRVHSANFGWLGWTSNGKDAGTAGYGYRMEAIQIKLVPKGTGADDPDAFKKPPMVLEMSAHVQNVGWQAWVDQTKTAGTTGRGLRIEALNIRITNSDYAGSIEYRTHVQYVGWQAWRSDGAMSGTTGRSQQVEAIRIRLTGDLANVFDIYYRAHVAGIGWLGWAKNGETAGTEGFSCQMEALQIRLVPKGGKAPGPTDNYNLSVELSAQANVSGRGWLGQVSWLTNIGTTGQSRQLEAFKLQVDSIVAGEIEYNAFVTGDGWQGWKKGDVVSGTEGENKFIEAIRIRLTGDLANYFDIYYRAHVSNWGWLGWAKNGANAGTFTVEFPMEAFQMAIVLKGGPSPGSNLYAYTDTAPLPATYRAMNTRIANVSSSTNWLIAIDTGNCLFGVYQKVNGQWVNRYMWLCSPGAWITPTPIGTFTVGSKGYVFGSGYSCYWWTQIFGDFLIHSVLYYPGTDIIMEGVMGVPASQGCVRLDIQNAKWVYDNIPQGSTIVCY